jgi:hypothetical protein
MEIFALSALIWVKRHAMNRQSTAWACRQPARCGRQEGGHSLPKLCQETARHLTPRGRLKPGERGTRHGYFAGSTAATLKVWVSSVS